MSGTFYTRTGDDGYTGLLGAERVPKYHPRPEAYGTVDEASAALGMARATATVERTRRVLLTVQRHLYHLMAELAATPEAAPRFRQIGDEQVAWLEETTDALTSAIALPREFVVPGESLAGAALDLARTIVRRAERRVARLVHEGQVENDALLRYLNRLSSLLFVLARYEDQQVSAGGVTLAKET
ncbi:MAG: cob(I)yrinic acid a,c-diamide adenosyltransferase [Chloroflexi bacterium]|nr:MAG: cob(I)yrinic acid a,c-diamide adenosyltransferase [Chloroflexota bacterium]